MEKEEEEGENVFGKENLVLFLKLSLGLKI